jgi:hypothetical protein
MAGTAAARARRAACEACWPPTARAAFTTCRQVKGLLARVTARTYRPSGSTNSATGQQSGAATG